MNPIVSDIKNARPAGKVMEANGKLYRVAQDCSTRYGSGFNINEIVSLTEDSYQERKVERVGPRWDNRILGMPTFNRDRKLTVIDAPVWRSRFSASLRRAAGALAALAAFV